ncbi:MAG: sodium:proton exchanger, partial [Chlorobium sp.]|nr:sodium:proton exchanger [Chlorobium sp.]
MPDLSFIHTVPFYEITALLVLAAMIGLFSLLLRQPLIVSLIAVGVLAGPSALDIVQSHEYIEL